MPKVRLSKVIEASRSSVSRAIQRAVDEQVKADENGALVFNARSLTRALERAIRRRSEWFPVDEDDVTFDED